MIKSIVTLANNIAKAVTVSGSKIVQGRASPILQQKLAYKNSLQEYERTQEDALKARTANMNPYEAERTRLQHQYDFGRSKLSKDELEEVLQEIRNRQAQQSYKKEGL